jgi:hypothetical protein
MFTFSQTGQPFHLLSRVFDMLFERQPASMAVVFMRLDRMTTFPTVVRAHAADLQTLILEDNSSHTYIHVPSTMLWTYTSNSDRLREEKYKTLFLNDNYDGNLFPPLLLTTKSE